MYGIELISDLDGSLMISSNARNLGFLGKAIHHSVVKASHDFYEPRYPAGHNRVYGRIYTYKIQHDSSVPPLIFLKNAGASTGSYKANGWWYFTFCDMSVYDNAYWGTVYCFGYFGNMNRKTNYGMEFLLPNGTIAYTTASGAESLSIDILFTALSVDYVDQNYTVSERVQDLPGDDVPIAFAYTTTMAVGHYTSNMWIVRLYHILADGISDPDSWLYRKVYFKDVIYAQSTADHNPGDIFTGYNKSVTVAGIYTSKWD